VIEVTGAILVRAGRLLLGFRAPHRSYPGCWDIFGGHIEAGETPLVALRRELLEELGLSHLEAAPIEVIRFEHPGEGATRLHVFRVDAWVGDPKIADDEHTELRWFTAEEALVLPNLPTPEYRRLFARPGLIG
jgi:8-oxo-dGTP diphosphatase